MQPRVEQLPIAEIVLDARLQMRMAMEEAVIQEYAENLDKLPPCKVMLDEGGQRLLYDGWHTLEAFKAKQQTHIPIVITQGSFIEALLAAAGANEEHGLRRTAGDKRKAV